MTPVTSNERIRQALTSGFADKWLETNVSPY